LIFLAGTAKKFPFYFFGTGGERLEGVKDQWNWATCADVLKAPMFHSLTGMESIRVFSEMFHGC
jgi:hypothetical protein